MWQRGPTYLQHIVKWHTTNSWSSNIPLMYCHKTLHCLVTLIRLPLLNFCRDISDSAAEINHMSNKQIWAPHISLISMIKKWWKRNKHFQQNSLLYTYIFIPVVHLHLFDCIFGWVPASQARTRTRTRTITKSTVHMPAVASLKWLNNSSFVLGQTEASRSSSILEQWQVSCYIRITQSQLKNKRFATLQAASTVLHSAPADGSQWKT